MRFGSTLVAVPNLVVHGVSTCSTGAVAPLGLSQISAAGAASRLSKDDRAKTTNSRDGVGANESVASLLCCHCKRSLRYLGTDQPGINSFQIVSGVSRTGAKRMGARCVSFVLSILRWLFCDGVHDKSLRDL